MDAFSTPLPPFVNRNLETLLLWLLPCIRMLNRRGLVYGFWSTESNSWLQTRLGKNAKLAFSIFWGKLIFCCNRFQRKFWNTEGIYMGLFYPWYDSNDIICPVKSFVWHFSLNANFLWIAHVYVLILYMVGFYPKITLSNLCFNMDYHIFSFHDAETIW